MVSILVAFAAGFVLDALGVLWVEAVERKRAALSGFVGGLFAAAQVLGLERAFRDPRASAAYVAGYAIGSWAAVRLSSRGKRLPSLEQLGRELQEAREREADTGKLGRSATFRRR